MIDEVYLQKMEQRIIAELTALMQKLFTALEVKIDGKVDTSYFESKLESKISGLRCELHEEIGELREEIDLKFTAIDYYMREKLATKIELHHVENTLVSHIDSLAHLYRGHDQEITTINSRLSRIEEDRQAA